MNCWSVRGRRPRCPRTCCHKEETMNAITEATKDMTYEEKLLVYRLLQELHATRLEKKAS